MNVSMRVRVILEVGYVDEADVEHITGFIESEESLWAGAGGDLNNTQALALYDSCAAAIKASTPE